MIFDVIQPASPGTKKQLDSLIKIMTSFGFKVGMLPSISTNPKDYLSNPDKVRLLELKKSFKTKSELVICLRGGYGSQRLLPFISKPLKGKILLGYSDITALQVTKAVEESIHGCWSWLKHKPNPEIFFSILRRKGFSVGIKYNLNLKVSGIAIAGNLSVLTDLLGTPFLRPPTEPFILFIEDTCEPLYRLDRMFFQLINSSYLKNCKAIGLGNFDYKGRIFNFELIKKILEGLKLNLPVFYFPFGHLGKTRVLIPQFWFCKFFCDKIVFEPG